VESWFNVWTTVLLLVALAYAFLRGGDGHEDC
jgi:hypothetical protein